MLLVFPGPLYFPVLSISILELNITDITVSAECLPSRTYTELALSYLLASKGKTPLRLKKQNKTSLLGRQGPM